MREQEGQSGFSIIEVSLIVLIIAALAATGFIVYQRHKLSNAKNSTTESQTQATTQQQGSTTKQTQQAATKYLTVKEWGIRLPLSSAINDAYYVVSVSNKGDDGKPNKVFLGLPSLDSTGCIAAGSNTGQNTAIAAIFKVLPTDTDVVSGKAFDQLYPGVTIGNYFYAYQSLNTSSTCKASQTSIQSAQSAFATAEKGIVAATSSTQYLTIKELGIRFKLSAAIEDAYYAVKPNTIVNSKPVIALYMHSLDTYRLCAPAGDPDGVAGIATFTPGQTDPVHGDFATSFPNAPLINRLHYFIENEQFDCSQGGSRNMDAISQAFKAAYPTIEAYSPN